MPELIIWKNQQIKKMRKDIDRMFNKMCGEFGLSAFPGQFKEFPPVDVSETADELIFKIEIPEYKPEDIEMSVTESNLTLKGTMKLKKVSNSAGHLTTERRQSSFSRKLNLPCRVIVDKVKANYKDGILHIKLPKYKSKKARALKIEG